MFGLRRILMSEHDDPIGRLRAQLRPIGNAEFPFLHPQYSPNSRVPCTDFTGFIVDRLENEDLKSIIELMHEILRANPGLGASDPSWIDGEIVKILRVPFNQYISFEDEKAYQELIAMWIVASKDGAARQFWVSPTSRFSTFFSWALCGYDLSVRANMAKALQRANAWLAEMRRAATFWQTVPDFDMGQFDIEHFVPGPAAAKILALPIGARLHLFTAVGFGSKSLADMTDYALRSFGLYIPDSVRSILASDILIPAADPTALLRTLSKDDLFRECQRLGIICKTTWAKQRLMDAITSVNPSFVKEISVAKSIVALNSEYAVEMEALVTRAKHLEACFKILCFSE